MTDYGLFVSLAITGFIGECSYAATTFGTAIIFQIGWEISNLCGIGDGKVSGAVVNLAVAELFMSSIQSVNLWRHFHTKFFVSTVFWICSSVILGCWLLLKLDKQEDPASAGTNSSSTWVKRSLGFFLLIVACFQSYTIFIYKKRFNKNTERVAGGGHTDAATTASHHRQLSVNSSANGSATSNLPSLLETDIASQMEVHNAYLEKSGNGNVMFQGPDGNGEEYETLMKDSTINPSLLAEESHSGSVPDLSSLSVQLSIAIAFSAAGTLGGLYGVAGPPLMLFMMRYGDEFSIDTWRGTTAVMRVFSSGTRFAFLAFEGAITFSDSASGTNWPAFGVMCASGVLGLCVGNKISPHIDKEAFRKLLLLFLSCGSLLLITSGWRKIQDIAILCIGGAAGLSLISFVTLRIRAKM